ESDEFDRNFLTFTPYMGIISGIAYDHHEIYPTEEAYREASRTYLDKSAWKVIWQSDLDKLGISRTDATYLSMDDNAAEIGQLTLDGEVNRRNAWAVITTVANVTKKPIEELLPIMNKFPGVSRRMEEVSKNLFTDYAHTPEKIAGAIQIAKE